ncbi:MAG: family 16 glycoside hydrolase [Candidatus Hydrogenedentota bacterium]
MMIRIGAMMMILALMAGTAYAQTPAEAAETVAAIAAYKRGGDRAPLIEVEKLVRESHGNAEVRNAIYDGLVKIIESDAAHDAKRFACRQLWILGPKEALPVLNPMLLDDDTVDMACYAIAQDPAPEAGQALRDALANADGNAEVAIANLLGDRRDAEAVEALCAVANGDRLPAARAAIRALGKIGTEAAADCLAKCLASNEATIRSAAMDASLVCAEELLKKDKRAKAKAIYSELAKENYPEAVQKAAQLGLNNVKLGPPIVLFDGENLDHWEGNMDIWRIENGAIVGGSLENPVPHNDFLCTKEAFEDFELRLKVKISSPDANAGIQIRSRRVPDSPAVSGYQADMGQNYWGCLYDEHRRNKILVNADQEKVKQFIDLTDWNDYVIRCEGKRIQLWLNGYQTADYTETDDSIPQSGIIGLQIHGGPPSQAYYKDIVIRKIKPIE